MIVVDVNLVSAFGREHDDSLGKVRICNTSGSGPLRDYKVTQYSRGKKPRRVKTVYIEQWLSIRKSAMALVIEAMRVLGESETKVT